MYTPFSYCSVTILILASIFVFDWWVSIRNFDFIMRNKVFLRLYGSIRKIYLLTFWEKRKYLKKHLVFTTTKFNSNRSFSIKTEDFWILFYKISLQIIFLNFWLKVAIFPIISIQKYWTQINSLNELKQMNVNKKIRN